jgi:hypothetical protein
MPRGSKQTLSFIEKTGGAPIPGTSPVNGGAKFLHAA